MRLGGVLSIGRVKLSLGALPKLGGVAPSSPAPLKAPTNARLPTIAGTPRAGRELTATPGSWAGNPAPAVSGQWHRDGGAIPGAAAMRYLLVAADVGASITYLERATNSAGTDAKPSNTVGPIAAAFTKPAFTALPVASGAATEGQTLSVTKGTTTGNPAPSLSYEWRRNGAPVPGAASAIYQLVAADVGANLTCAVTASNSEGSDTSVSNAIGPIASAATAPAKMAAPALAAGDKQITVTRAAAPATGGSAITGYDARYSSNGGATWTLVNGISAAQVIAALANGTVYAVQTRANNSVGNGPWSDSATATPGAAQATVFRDSFGRADGTLVGSDSNWTLASGNANALSIVNGQLATAAAEGAFQSPDLGNANQYAKHLIAGGGAVGPFLVCRLTDQNNWGAAARYNVNTGTGQVWKRQGGTLTQYGSTSGSPCVVGATLELQTVGDMTQLVVNGAVAAGPYTMDGAGAGVTRSGYVTRTNANSPWADNYENGHLAALTT